VDLSLITGVVADAHIAEQRYNILRQNFRSWMQLSDHTLMQNMESIKRIRALLRSEKFDLIHVHGLGFLSVVKPAAIGLGVPVAATYHPSAHGHNQSDFKTNLSLRDHLRYRLFLKALSPDVIFAQATDSYDLFTKKCGLPNAKVVKMLTGISSHYRPPSADEKKAARNRFSLNDDDFVCVLPGRLNINKGHDVAIAAFQALRTARPDIKPICLFTGAGPQEAEIRQMVAQSGISEQFKMVGFLADLREAYWASDIVILPSRMEGFAMVVAEAMACGCVAIRTPSGGSADQIVPGKTGFTVNFNDPLDLSKRLAAVADRATLYTMGRSAAEHALTKFSANSMISITISTYNALVKAKQRNIGVNRHGNLA
jgi:glycosyltransferase involved in cell wall biosynthesis